MEAARQALERLDPDLAIQLAPDGAGTVSFKQAASEARRQQAVAQSIEIIRRRIDETGTKEPTIQRQGQNRILVQLPGVDNPEHVKALLGRTAKLTFQLVDTSVNMEDARRGRLPPGDEILPAQDDRSGGPGQYVVRKRVMVGGEMLVDAQATFHDNEPVVSFKFDSVGARRFGDATRENVGKPFAIVLDNKVISAPVIREPILGGSGIISGSFTAQSASDLALLLRAGALPAPITILEERTVGAQLGADSIRAGSLASIVAVILVIVFMVLFYGLFGVFADIALFFNLCLMLAVLSLLGATLDAARHCRYRADDGHGGRRQRADLRAHQGGAAQRAHDAVLARSRLQSRFRHDPRQPYHDAGRRNPALLARFGSGEGVRGHAQHRRVDLPVLGDPRHPAADRGWLRRWRPREIPL